MTYHLVAVTGMSPQVITETLYAMNRNGDAWPDRLTVITTARGRERIWKGLQEDGYLARLCHELGRPPLAFGHKDILVVPDAAGREVEDARSSVDHEAMADFITDSIRDFTADEDVRLHASIAGGRKTMTFYLGYAMSLFGRHTDQLSHVLVSEPYEGRPDFYFPTRESCLLAQREGDRAPLDARDAEVILADIPFVRQRSQLPKIVREQLGAKLSYRQLMNLINLGDRPDRVRMTLLARQRKLIVEDMHGSRDGRAPVRAEVTFPNLLVWAFYLLLVEAALQGESDDYTRPASSKEGRRQAQSLAKMLIGRVYELMGRGYGTESAQDLARALLNDDDALDWLSANGCQERSIRTYAEKDKGLDAGAFSNYLNGITSALEEQLPGNLQKLLTPAQRPTEDGSRQRGRKQGAGYGIDLPDLERQIQIQYL